MPPEMIPVFKGSLIFAYLIVGIVYSFYIRNLYKLLSLVNTANRRLQPSAVFLLAVNFLSIITIVPLFIDKNIALRYTDVLLGIRVIVMAFVLIFNFFMVNKIAESLDAELKSRNVTNDPKPTLSLGMFMCICNTGALLSGIGILAFFGAIAGVAGVVAWIMYWAKTNEYKVKLKNMPRSNSLNDLGIF